MTASLATGALKAKDRKRKAIRAILASLKKGSSIYSACNGAGINVTTFWRWRLKSPKLEKLVGVILESQITIVEDALYGEAVKGNPVAMIFFLTNRAGDKWKDRRALVNNINAIKIGDGKRVDREFTGVERDEELRLIEFLRNSAQ